MNAPLEPEHDTGKTPAAAVPEASSQPQPDNPETAPPVEAVPRQKKWLSGLYALVALMAVLAIIGLVMAMTGRSTDPASIRQPISAAQAVSQEVEEAQPANPVADRAEMERQTELNETVLPELQQSEMPLKLEPSKPGKENSDKENSEKPKPEATPKLLDKSDIAPQSMIIWDQPKPAAPVVPAKGPKPQIVIVIDDMGVNMRRSREMAELRYPTTLAYMPYADNLQRQTKQAFDNGHELIVHMPMEPQDMAHNNPGPDALLTSLSAEENRARLLRNLSKFDGYIGLNNHMGSKITASRKAMLPIMQTIKEKGLWFLDSRTIGNSVAGPLAEELQIPYVTRDVFLDNMESVDAILKQLRQLEQIAASRGYAIGIGHPYGATVEALKQWMPAARQRGFEFVPLSTVIAKRYPHVTLPRYARSNALASSPGKEIVLSSKPQ